jgi:hypothetical protein
MLSRICVCGRLTSPTTLLLDDSTELHIAPETFYVVGEKYYFLIDMSQEPVRVLEAMKCSNP